MKISAIVKRGKYIGTALYPHKNKDGSYVVSKTRFAEDYIYVKQLEDILQYVEKGFSVRMSNPDAGVAAASLISRDALKIEK